MYSYTPLSLNPPDHRLGVRKLDASTLTSARLKARFLCPGCGLRGYRIYSLGFRGLNSTPQMMVNQIEKNIRHDMTWTWVILGDWGFVGEGV